MNGLAICAGIGGIELGVQLANPGYRAVCFIERQAYAAAVLVARMEEEATLDKAPIWDNVESFDGYPWRGFVEVVTAGFPCQPFSTAGQHKGLDDERWLWPDIARIIREVGPRFVFLENVPSVVRSGFPVVLRDLAEAGFDAEWGVFSARGSGAPHIRKRFFLLAKEAHVADADICGLQTERIGGLLDRERATRWEDSDGRSRWWEVEPDVGRVADGVASGVDRLHAIGNGVVPSVAARAWQVLAARLQ